MPVADANANDFSAVMHAFFPKKQIEKICAYGSGNINKTYKVTLLSASTPYLLQRINTHTFSNVAALMNNVAIVSGHLKKKLETTQGEFKEALVLVQTDNGHNYHQDKEGNVWRVYRFIAGSKSYEKVKNAGQAKKAGEAFGAFQQAVAGIDPSSLAKTIKGFHELPHVLANFQEVLSSVDNKILDNNADILSFIATHQNEMLTLDRLREENKLPLRITHNDTKFNNVLFNENDELLCVVDYDTVMPGLVHHDYGDAVRIIANKAVEDEADLEKVGFDLALFKAFSQGFLSNMTGTLTVFERETLPLAIPLMPFMLGVRFLADHLAGDPYFNIDFRGHNLQRARAQLALVKDVLAKQEAIHNCYSHFG